METTSAIVFIGLLIVGVTELLKGFSEKDYRKCALIAASAVIGALVGALDVQLGLTNVTIAQGITAGLAASGGYKVASKVG